MSILGVVTNNGLAAAQDAALNEGFNLVPTRFGVSDVSGTLDPTRENPTSGQFFTAPINSRVIIDQNTIKFVLTVPPNQISTGTFKIVREVYLYINDSSNNEILFAVGQPTDTIRYNFDQELTLDLEFSIVNLNLIDNFVFEFTQATEIAEHNTDPNAHPDIIAIMRKAGLFIPMGAYTFDRRGQTFEDNGGNGVEFEGNKSSVTSGGVTFTSTFNGDELNGFTIEPDGLKTVDELRSEFNAANYPNTIEHDGVGTEVLGGGTLILTAGSYVVQDKDVVYKDVDGIYKQAIADGTIKSRVAGIAFREDKLIVSDGFIGVDTGYDISTPLYLSSTVPGAITNFNTNINLGLGLGDFIYFTGFASDITSRVSQDFDAVVTTTTGAGQFLTTQDAIDDVPNGGRILINKIDQIAETIETNGKQVEIVFNGPETGWERFPGLNSQFRLDFDSVPTQGTFRIEWNNQESNDIDFDATALEIQNEFNLLEGSNGFTVTGDFSSGFVFTSNDENTYPLPTFTFAGTNEIQRYDFSNVPNDGTIQFEKDGQATLNFPWDDSASDLQIALQALPNLSNVIVTGEFAQQFFQIEYDGGFLQDGNQEQTPLEAVMFDLDLNGAPTNVNGTTVTPVEASIVQKGKKPASNLYNGSTLINITTTAIEDGSSQGADRAINIDSPYTQITGFGKISNFSEGIYLDNATTGNQIEVYFENVAQPILTNDKIPGVDYDIEALGFAKDVLSQLRVTEHPTNKKRLKITGAEQILASGITLGADLNSLLMSFSGAEIDFSTDPIEIYASDGVTPLGVNIARPVIAQSQFRWFSINIIPEITETDLSLKAQILLLPAANDGSTKETAEKPPFGDKPIGLVAVEGAFGDAEITELITVRNDFGSLTGKTFILEGKLSNNPGPSEIESVAFWFSDESLDTFPLQDETSVTGNDESPFNSVVTNVQAGKISLAASTTFDTVDVFLRRTGNPTGNLSVRVLGESGGLPDLGNVLATGLAVVEASEIGTDFVNPSRVRLNSEITLPVGDYFIEVDADNLVTSGGNFIGWNVETNGASVELFNRDPSGSTWLSDNGNVTAKFQLRNRNRGIPLAAQAADREVEITTLGDEDLQSVVAQKVQAVINTDVLFNASVNTNRVTITNVNVGDVADIDLSDSGFFATITQQGTETDTTGVEDISNANIIQLGAGTGSGGGSGGGPSFLQDLKFQLKTSNYEFVTASVFSDDQDSKIDSSTGSYSFSERAWELAAGQNLLTINLLDPSYLFDSIASSVVAQDVRNIDVTVKYKDVDNIDPAAVYEASIDGGANFETIEMERIGETDTFVASLFEFDDSGYAFSTFNTYSSTNLDSNVLLDDNTSQEISQEFTTPADFYQITRTIQTYFSKVGSPSGFYGIKIVKDDAGSPSTDPNDLVYTSELKDIELQSVGNFAVTYDVPFALLEPSTKYHLVHITDDTYKDSGYVFNTDEIRVRIDSSSSEPSLQVFDGSSYSVTAGSSCAYIINGRELDLRLRITSSVDTLIEGFGVFYGLDLDITGQSNNYPTELIYLNGDDNTTLVPISQFQVNTDTIMVIDLDTQESWAWPAFSLSGNNLIFKQDTFNRPGEGIRLKAIQVGGGSTANDDNINQQLAENHVWSGDSSKDNSTAGRGNTYRDGANNPVELAIDENGLIAFIFKG
jgi:hypothetical protein